MLRRVDEDVVGGVIWPVMRELESLTPDFKDVTPGFEGLTSGFKDVTGRFKEGSVPELIAIRLDGAWGRQLLVRDNHFAGCPTGIAFRPSGTPSYFVWVFQCNVAQEEGAVVLRLPRLEEIVEEHNLPRVEREAP